VGEEKTALFVVVPPTDKSFNFIAGILFTQLFQELQYCAAQVHKQDGQRLPVPCRFILDEFANTCKIPNFVNILAYARSFGIGIVPILQSLEQIKNMYKDEWGVIIDNCNTLLFLGSIQHMDTLEYMSKLLGKGTYDKKTTGRTRGRQGSSSQNFDVVGRELMTPDEIRKLDKSKCLFIAGGRNPFYSDKYDYTTHPNYRYTSDSNKSYSYEYTPSVKAESKKEEFPHGEDKLNDNGLMPSENVNVVVEEIEIDFSLQNMVNRMGREFAHLIPVPDDEVTVDDGETVFTEEQKLILFENLLSEENEAEEEINKMFSDETNAYLIELEKDNIVIDSSLTNQINRLGRTARYLVPVPDDDITVDDGERNDVTPELAEFVFDEDSDIDMTEALDDIMNEVEDLINMSAMIESDDIFRAEIEDSTQIA